MQSCIGLVTNVILRDNTDKGGLSFFIPKTMAKHVHYLQQRFDTQLPGKIIKLSEKRHKHENRLHFIVTLIIKKKKKIKITLLMAVSTLE